MEPFEADQSNQGQVDVYEDNPDDTFAEDGIEESQMEDTEYNNVMKGEEEPQAGTSGDGMGENQGTFYFLNGAKHPMLVFNNYKYKVMKRDQDSTSWRCVGYDSYKCKGRIRTTRDVALVINNNHTHEAPRTDLSRCVYSRKMYVRRWGSRSRLQSNISELLTSQMVRKKL